MQPYLHLSWLENHIVNKVCYDYYMNKTKWLITGAWLLSLLVSVLSVFVWGQSMDWKLGNLTTYQIFPVLGLIAFSLMWSHYIVSVARQHFGMDKSVTKTYFDVTSWIVLIAIVLHPGLLIYQLYRDGLGLPPFSYERVYGWLTVLGTVSLLAFLAYELRRFYSHKKWWRFVEYIVDAAMLAIFYHGLNLGTQLHVDWFRWLWYFYGLTLVASLIYIYVKKFSANTKQTAL